MRTWSKIVSVTDGDCLLAVRGFGVIWMVYTTVKLQIFESGVD